MGWTVSPDHRTPMTAPRGSSNDILFLSANRGTSMSLPGFAVIQMKQQPIELGFQRRLDKKAISMLI